LPTPRRIRSEKLTDNFAYIDLSPADVVRFDDVEVFRVGVN